MTDDSTTSSTDGGNSRSPSRKRGKGFPVVPLSEASRILKEAGKYGFEHSTASFAAHMGHSSTTSGSFRQRLAAFREWGLVTGRGDMLTMTEVARKVAMPPDDDAEREALRQAFWNCAVFAGLHEGMAKGQPLEQDRVGSQGGTWVWRSSKQSRAVHPILRGQRCRCGTGQNRQSGEPTSA